MPPQSSPNIPDEEFFETLDPGSTRPQDDFLNRPRPTNNTPIAEGATYSTSQTSTPNAPNNNGVQVGQTRRQDVQENPTVKRRRISNGSAALMIATAFVCDLLGPFGAVGAIVIFFIWFKIKGVPVLGLKQIAKQAANLGLNGLAEVLSAGVWVGVTLSVSITILLSRIEDATGIDVVAVTSLASAGKSAPTAGATTATTTPKQSSPNNEGLTAGATSSRINI